MSKLGHDLFGLKKVITPAGKGLHEAIVSSHQEGPGKVGGSRVPPGAWPSRERQAICGTQQQRITNGRIFRSHNIQTRRASAISFANPCVSNAPEYTPTGGQVFLPHLAIRSCQVVLLEHGCFLFEGEDVSPRSLRPLRHMGFRRSGELQGKSFEAVDERRDAVGLFYIAAPPPSVLG